MDWVFSQTKERYFLSPSQQPYFLSQSSPPPPPTLQSGGSFDVGNKISPSILLIIIILAVIFFISGLLHLLVRFLFRPTIRDPEDSDNVTALQGQLQQLFHLHDAGVDQSYIDTLPVFFYNAIMGLKKPFDCAVCLCEFEADDKLRLLPKCSHAFHLECIDTWLLSHSTCPLCRGSLLPDFSPNDNCSPVVYVLESGSESSREIIADRDAPTVLGTNTVAGGTNTNLGIHGEDELGASCNNVPQKFSEIPIKDDVVPVVDSAASEEKVVPVKLGKFRNLDVVAGREGEGEGSSSTNSNSGNSNFDSRRCFSMGSFEYVMDESSSLQVSIRPLTRKQTNTKPLKPGYRSTMSECDGHSCREGFKGFESVKNTGIHGVNGRISTENSVGRSKNESFSISKIWLRSKKEKPSSIHDSSRRAFSFRFPLNRPNAADDLKNKQNNNNNNSSRRTISEVDVGRWDHCVSELDYDEEVGSRNSLDSQSSLPSFARKTLLWLVGRQNKVVHSSSTPNV
ncbi:zinc finger protein [Macleaya cordata]|uniref:RING-type E3 ubiquitin transferase n=1 Tax=Macleaya cordata TaxID=56857 RepID=A0A200QZ70_MACCD|nr:zinc finger protein [Macleaya cordata]